MSIHPVQHFAFWQTKQPEVQQMSVLYDEIVKGDPDVKKKLNELIVWARDEARRDEAYYDCE